MNIMSIISNRVIKLSQILISYTTGGPSEGVIVNFPSGGGELQDLVNYFNQQMIDENHPVRWIINNTEFMKFGADNCDVVELFFTTESEDDTLAIGGAYEDDATPLGVYKKATKWGSRLPDLIDIGQRYLGGFNDREFQTIKIAGKDFNGTNRTSSSKYIERNGFTVKYRLLFDQLDRLEEWIELSRNNDLWFIDGENWGINPDRKYNILTEGSGGITTEVDYLQIVLKNLSFLEVKNAEI
jgi:hypothetical protein